MSIPFLVANYRTYSTQPGWLRPTSEITSYISGTSGGSVISIGLAYDNNTSATLDTSTAGTVAAAHTSGTRNFCAIFSGFGTGAFTGGKLYLYIQAEATDLDNLAFSTINVSYELTTGAGFTAFSDVNLPVQSPAASNGQPTSYIGEVVSHATNTLTITDLSQLRVRVACSGIRTGSVLTIDSASSVCYVYDIVLK